MTIYKTYLYGSPSTKDPSKENLRLKRTMASREKKKSTKRLSEICAWSGKHLHLNYALRGRRSLWIY